jgi:hypothetical protein
MRQATAGLFVVMAMACGESNAPQAPSAQLAASLPPTVSSRLVTCNTCIQPPFSWQTADFTVVVSDPSGRGGTVALVEAVVRDVSLGVDLGSNRIPNGNVGLPNGVVPNSGTLAVPMGITFDIPPPQDDVRMTVTVTLTDGRRASATARMTT